MQIFGYGYIPVGPDLSLLALIHPSAWKAFILLEASHLHRDVFLASVRTDATLSIEVRAPGHGISSRPWGSRPGRSANGK